MNNLQKILETYTEFGLKLDHKEYDGGELTKLFLVDNLGAGWYMVFEIIEDLCTVTEYNYDCQCVKEAEETVSTFDEALDIASEWC